MFANKITVSAKVVDPLVIGSVFSQVSWPSSSNRTVCNPGETRLTILGVLSFSSSPSRVTVASRGVVSNKKVPVFVSPVSESHLYPAVYRSERGAVIRNKMTAPTKNLKRPFRVLVIREGLQFSVQSLQLKVRALLLATSHSLLAHSDFDVSIADIGYFSRDAGCFQSNRPVLCSS